MHYQVLLNWGVVLLGVFVVLDVCVSVYFFGWFPYSRYLPLTRIHFCRCKRKTRRNYFRKHIFIAYTINVDSCCCRGDSDRHRRISFAGECLCNMHVGRWKPRLAQATEYKKVNANTMESMKYENVRPDIAQCEVNGTHQPRDVGTHNLAYILIIHHDFFMPLVVPFSRAFFCFNCFFPIFAGWQIFCSVDRPARICIFDQCSVAFIPHAS